MGSLFKRTPHGPVISTSPVDPPLPPEGGVHTTYKVEGIWKADGTLVRPDRLVVELDVSRVTEKPGDTLKLTRLEATVLGQTVMLVPVFEAE
jgi:hypothetical protein